MALQNGGGDSPDGKCLGKFASVVEHSPGVTAVLFLPTTSFCCVNKKHMKLNRLWAQIFAKNVLFTQDVVCDIDSVVELTLEDRLFIKAEHAREMGSVEIANRTFDESKRTMGHNLISHNSV